MKKSFSVIVFLLLVFCLFVLFRPSDNYSNCSNELYFSRLSFTGTVIKKFIDTSDHSTPKIEIKDFYGQIFSISFFGDYSDLFEAKIKVDQVIKKEKNDLTIFISVEGNEFIPLETAEFDCNLDRFRNEERKFGFLYRLFD